MSLLQERPKRFVDANGWCVPFFSPVVKPSQTCSTTKGGSPGHHPDETKSDRRALFNGSLQTLSLNEGPLWPV
ncbi:hypothetical protein CDAR_603621 [Caerostris darwini]|uniref:Uncharacterized protein n=1 Tax=Caerostris darwini TaxID=1538125 RepID=A0AAV4T4V1_9ARAC|nr:hypothetical protein CDAR_603621 [Caerostris darwini]